MHRPLRISWAALIALALSGGLAFAGLRLTFAQQNQPTILESTYSWFADVFTDGFRIEGGKHLALVVWIFGPCGLVGLAVYEWLRCSAPDRRDGLLRCPQCGHILRGLTEPRCPECGRPI